MERNTLIRKTSQFIIIGVILGLLTIIFPTYLFYLNQEQNGKIIDILTRAENFQIPLIDAPSDYNQIQKITLKEVGALGLSIIFASLVYIRFKKQEN
jgi:hypothetical protein